MSEPGRLTRKPALPDLATAVYLACAVLILSPLIDMGATLWPFRYGESGWRYGAVGLLSGFLLTPLLGTVMAMVLATSLSHRTLLRLLGVFSLACGIGLLLGTGLFTFDALQVRSQLPPEGYSAFEMNAGRVGIKTFVVAVSQLLLFVGAMRAARTLDP